MTAKHRSCIAARVIKYIFILLFLIVFSVLALLIYKGYSMYAEVVDSPEFIDKIENIINKDNFTSLEEIPKIYIDAVISVEDHRFYSHNGFDIVATGRALWNDIKAGSLVEGGSTITQQIAKNLYYTQEKKFTRKIAEVFTAFKIEQIYEKDEILEIYINSIFYGDGYECIYDASMGYFGKLPKDMTDYECTLLAGIPNAPSAYSPSVNFELSLQRQRQVLNKMIKNDCINEKEADDIAAGLR